MHTLTRPWGIVRNYQGHGGEGGGGVKFANPPLDLGVKYHDPPPLV